MRFAFDADALALRDGLRALLEERCPPEAVRAAAATPRGWSPERWQQLAALGVTGCLVAPDHGGLGLDERSIVLLLEEAGRACLPEPLGATAAVAAPLIAEAGGGTAAGWLRRIASGGLVVAVGLPGATYVANAEGADLLLLVDGDALHAVDPGAVTVTPQPTVDQAQRWCSVTWQPSSSTLLAVDAGAALAAARDRASVAEAAHLLGVARRLIELATAHAKSREQFGVPIGSFQAVKHQLATALVQVAFAAPVTYRAAWSVALADPSRRQHAAMAKIVTARAAETAARVALQIHGAMGYTWEHHVHLWLTRAWTIGGPGGDAAEHRATLARALLRP